MKSDKFQTVNPYSGKIRPGDFFAFGERPSPCTKCGEEASHDDYIVEFVDNDHGGLLVIRHLCGWTFATPTYDQSKAKAE